LSIDKKGMIWKGTPYYAHIEYNDKTDPEDGLPDEDVNAIDEIPVYSINKPKEESLAILKILSNVKGSQKIMKKNRLLEQLEEAGLVDKNLSGAAKHSRLNSLFELNKQLSTDYCCNFRSDIEKFTHIESILVLTIDLSFVRPLCL
jgi:hypothetical protein